MTDHDKIYQAFKADTDTPAHIKKWTDNDNHETRDRASLDNKNEFDLPSGRHNAEKVLELKAKERKEWSAGRLRIRRPRGKLCETFGGHCRASPAPAGGGSRRYGADEKRNRPPKLGTAR